MRLRLSELQAEEEVPLAEVRREHRHRHRGADVVENLQEMSEKFGQQQIDGDDDVDVDRDDGGNVTTQVVSCGVVPPTVDSL